MCASSLAAGVAALIIGSAVGFRLASADDAQPASTEEQEVVAEETESGGQVVIVNLTPVGEVQVPIGGQPATRLSPEEVARLQAALDRANRGGPPLPVDGQPLADTTPMQPASGDDAVPSPTTP